MGIVITRARQTTTTSGTTTPLQLDGAAPTGFSSFVAGAISEQGGAGPWSDIYYLVVSGSAFELGSGTLTDAATDTISRTTIHRSSNSDAIVDLPTGAKTIFSWPPGSAIVPISNRVRAEMSTSQSIGAAQWTTIQYAQEIQDEAGDYNNSTYTWTVPSNGWYACFFGVRSAATEAMSLGTVTTSGNGSWQQSWADTTGSGAASWTRYLTSGWTVQFQIYTADASSINDDSDQSVLNICRLGD